MQLLTIFKLLIIISKLFAQTQNCSYLNEPRPQLVQYLNGLGTVSGGFPFESVANIKNDAASGYLPRVIECSGVTPIELIVNTHHPEEFEIARNLIQIKNTTIGVRYSIIVQFLYTPHNPKHPVMFSCQPINLHKECENAVFWEITPPNLLTPSSQFRITATPSNQTFQDLIKYKYDRPIKKQESLCDIKLILKQTRSNMIEYKWEPENLGENTQILKSTNAPTYFHGVYRHIHTNQNCVKLLNEEESCKNCELFVDTGFKQNSIINAVVFYLNISSREYVFKGVFNISRRLDGPRKFYLEHGVSLNEMIHFEPPSVFYVNQRTVVNCSVSVLYFAHGTVIITDQNEATEEIATVEYYKEDGRREVSKTFTFRTGNLTTNLYCRSPLFNFTTKIKKTKRVIIEYPNAPSFIKTDSSDVFEVSEGKEGHMISCQATGKPLPSISWIFPTNVKSTIISYTVKSFNDLLVSSHEFKIWVQDIHTKLNISFPKESNEFVKSEIAFPAMNLHFIGTYTCTATNYLGTVSKPFTFKILQGVSPTAKILIGTVFGTITLICGLILSLMYRKMRIERYKFRTETEKCIEEFRNGTKVKEINDEHNNLQHHREIFEQPYNNSFEIPIDLWVIEDTFLGQGHFGFVKKGKIVIGDKIEQIAVKMLKSSVEIEGFNGFLFELKIMAYIGTHPNVVRLVAACTENIHQHEVMIGVEFCENGSLLEYLKNRRAFQISLFGDGDAGVAIMESGNKRAIYDNIPDLEKINKEQLFMWSYQIADGMEFLELKRVLHGDLAARNVLLTIDKIAKISDFGLSRVLLDSSNYTKKSEVPLPWKYMALESLKFMNFSSSSDVWSYGITLWEIFSFGETPYPGLNWNRLGFIEKLEMGIRPLKPIIATDFTYEIMKSCWNKNPLDRPTFSQLKIIFIQMLANINNPDENLSPEEPKINKRSPIPQPRIAYSVTYSNFNETGTIIQNVYSNT